MRRGCWGVGGSVVIAVMLSGCVGADPGSTEGGFGLPTLDPDAASAALAAGGVEALPLSGTLAVETNGCFTWDAADASSAEHGAWIVWPASAEQDADSIMLWSGEFVTAGDALAGVGGVVTLGDLPDGANPDSYLAQFGAFCGADERGVLVLVDLTSG